MEGYERGCKPIYQRVVTEYGYDYSIPGQYVRRSAKDAGTSSSEAGVVVRDGGEVPRVEEGRQIGK